MYKTFRDKQDGCIKVVHQAMRMIAMPRRIRAQERAGRRAHSGHEALARGPRLVLDRRSASSSSSAPRRLTRALGLDGHEALVRAYGVREVATGVAILASHDPTPWIWGRVGGDALDLATLAVGLSRRQPAKGQGRPRDGALLGATALDLYCAGRLTEERGRPQAPPTGLSRPERRRRSARAMVGAAREQGFETPEDMRGPPALRPYRDGSDPLSTATRPA